MKVIHKNIVAFLFFLTLLMPATGQMVDSYKSKGESLGAVIDSLAQVYNVKIAYDANSFNSIMVDLELKKQTFAGFLKILESEYYIKSENVAGTWVLVLDEPDVVVSVPEKKKDCVVAGYVTDKTTGEKLMYCNVLAGSNRGGMTNEMGYFSFSMPATDSVQILISHLAYHSIDTIVPAGQTVQLELLPHEIWIDPIQVLHYEKQVLQPAPETGVIAFNPARSDELPRVASDDLANALLIIPGVNFMQGAASGLSIRGSIPTDNLVLFDGIPVLETSHLLGNMSVLNSKFVHQVFVSRGGFDAEYGGRIAGLIQVIGKSGKNKNFYLDLSANMLNSNVLVNVPLTDKFSVTAAWRRSFIDSWQNYFYDLLIDNVNVEGTEFSTVNPLIRYQDINTKISYHPSEKLELNLNFLYGSDMQNRDFALFRTDDFYRFESSESSNTGLGLNLNWQQDRRWLHTFSGGYSSFEKIVVDETGELEEVTEVIENPSEGKGKGKGLIKTREKTFERQVFDIDNGTNRINEMRVFWKSDLQTGNVSSTAGIEWTADTYGYNFYTERPLGTVPVDSIKNDESLYLLHAFVQQKITLLDRFSFKWGLRTNADLLSGVLYWQPRGSVDYDNGKGLNFYYKGGIYNQFLTAARRFDSENRYSYLWHLATKGENVVKSLHHIAGVRFEKNGWYIDMEGWQKDTWGKLNLFATTVSTGNTDLVVYLPETSEEKSMGVDFFLQKKHRNFNHMISYSYSKIQERFINRYNSEWFSGYSDRPHQLKLIEMVNWKSWILTASMNYASGLPLIDLSSSGTMVDAGRTGFYAQTDLAVVKQWSLPHTSVHAGVSLLNIFDRKNVVEVSYLRFSSAQESLTVRSDVSALGFAPVFFINFKIH